MYSPAQSTVMQWNKPIIAYQSGTSHVQRCLAQMLNAAIARHDLHCMCPANGNLESLTVIMLTTSTSKALNLQLHLGRLALLLQLFKAVFFVRACPLQLLHLLLQLLLALLSNSPAAVQLLLKLLDSLPQTGCLASFLL